MSRNLDEGIDFVRALGVEVRGTEPGDSRDAVYFPNERLLLLGPHLSRAERDRFIDRMLVQLG